MVNVDKMENLTQNNLSASEGFQHEEFPFTIYTDQNRTIEVMKYSEAPIVNETLVNNDGLNNDGVLRTPLLFVHGWGLTSRSYRIPLLTLTDRYDVYAPTLPGFGKSSPLNRGFSLNHYAESVDRVWSECELSNEAIPLVAHSMGAGVAVKLALKTSNPVKSLTLVCPIGGSVNKVSWSKVVASFRGDVTYDMLNHAKDSLPHLLRHPGGALRAAVLAKTADLSNDLRECVEMGIPVSVIFTTNDSITPPGKIEKIDGVRYALKEGTHGWMLKYPHLFKETVCELL